MTNKHGIERLEGKGITAKVIDVGALYTTFKSFADEAGYPDAFKPTNKNIYGKTVKVLAKGKHDNRNRTLFLIEDGDGAHYVIGGRGLDIRFPHEPTRLTIDEIINAYERGYDRGKADAMAEMRRVIGE